MLASNFSRGIQLVNNLKFCIVMIMMWQSSHVFTCELEWVIFNLPLLLIVVKFYSARMLAIGFARNAHKKKINLGKPMMLLNFIQGNKFYIHHQVYVQPSVDDSQCNSSPLCDVVFVKPGAIANFSLVMIRKSNIAKSC